MRLDLLSRRGPGGRSTSASALRPAAAAAISVGVRGGTAPRQPRSGTRGVWPQRVCWLGYENASGDSCRRAPTVASSAFSRPPVRGEAKEPPRRLAKHRRVAPLTRGGVTAPPSKPLTKGGESQARVGWPCTSQPPPWRARLAEHRGRSRQRAQVPARHRRPGGSGTNAIAPAACVTGGVSHPSAFLVHNDPDVTVHLWIGNGPCPRKVKSRLRRGGSNAIPNGRRSILRGGPIGAVPSSRRSAGGRPGSRPSPRPPRRPCRGWHSRCA